MFVRQPKKCNWQLALGLPHYSTLYHIIPQYIYIYFIFCQEFSWGYFQFNSVSKMGMHYFRSFFSEKGDFLTPNCWCNWWVFSIFQTHKSRVDVFLCFQQTWLRISLATSKPIGSVAVEVPQIFEASIHWGARARWFLHIFLLVNPSWSVRNMVNWSWLIMVDMGKWW